MKTFLAIAIGGLPIWLFFLAGLIFDTTDFLSAMGVLLVIAIFAGAGFVIATREGK